MDGDPQKIFNIDKTFGAIGYVYKGTFRTSSNGTVTATYAYINIDNSKLPYYFRLFLEPSTSAELLTQVNKQGAKGFRYASGVLNGTVQLLEYVKDRSRPLANYTYRHEPCVSNQDELFAQINKNAARGYRAADSYRIDDSCVLYIKDRSQRSKYMYKRVSDFNNTEDLIKTLDKLGAEGYRYAGYGSITFVSNGTSSSPTVPLYYRDKTQKDCTFSYSSASMPDSPATILALLREQEKKGFIYSSLFSTSNGSFLIFVKFHKCDYKSMNIDASY